MLKPCHSGSKWIKDAEKTGYSVVSETKLACALTTQADIWYATKAALHARRAIQNATTHRGVRPHDNEEQWQVERLGIWLSEIACPRCCRSNHTTVSSREVVAQAHLSHPAGDAAALMDLGAKSEYLAIRPDFPPFALG